VAGSPYCWGTNNFGELGAGTSGPDPVLIPIAVLGGLSLVTLDLGEDHACGVQSDGTGFCWGLNTYGKLGNGTAKGTVSPVPVSGGLHFRLISTGNYHTCGLTTRGQPFCWGQNAFGQLGDGSTRNSYVPVAVADSSLSR
jgi:alpha-tubulin suppressor-like RCC1 family protein